MKSAFFSIFMKSFQVVIGLLILLTAIPSFAVEDYGTTVKRDADGCTVHMIIQVGVEGTSAQVKKVSDALKKHFNLTCIIPCDNDPDEACMVDITINVQKWDTLKADTTKYHHVKMTSQSKYISNAYVRNPNRHPSSGTWKDSSSKWADEIYAHEVLHFSGLKDKYCDLRRTKGKNNKWGATTHKRRCPKPPGPDPCTCTFSDDNDNRCTAPCNDAKKDLMGTLRAKVTCDNILAIVDLAGLKSCPENPCCLHATSSGTSIEDKNTDGKDTSTGSSDAPDDVAIIVQYDFDNLGMCDEQGWYGVDRTAAYGDFSGQFSGLSILQEDMCSIGLGCLWGFFEGSMYDYACAGYPNQLVVPFEDVNGNHIYNQIFSPVIQLDTGGALPPNASRIVLEYTVYQDFPLDNLTFYSWAVRPGGLPHSVPWRNRNTVYYSSTKGWITISEDIGDLIEPGATNVQLAIGVRDMCGYWCGTLGSGSCHSHAPLISSVVLYRTGAIGPVWGVHDADLFQDNFPEDGTTTGAVRMDMARDIAPHAAGFILPGDSVTVSVSEPNVGLGLDPMYNKAAVYMYVRSTGGQVGSDVSGDNARWPVVGTSGGWTQILMDTVYIDPGPYMPVPHKYCADLNDNLFSPPDRVDFYFSATDANGVTKYWSQEVGAVTTQAQARSAPMEVQCLPTGSSDILYVDDFSGRGAQPLFDTAFDVLGIQPDRYDVRGPSSLVGNGLGSRAQLSQIVDVYQKILWNSGNLNSGTLGDCTRMPEKSDDVGLLFQYLDQTNRYGTGLYLTGDNIAAELKNLGGPLVPAFLTYIDYDLVNHDHVSMGSEISPLVVGSMPGTIFQHDPDGAGPLPAYPDSLVAVGGCPGLSAFDVMQPIGTSNSEMYYASLGPGNSAVISQSTINSMGTLVHVVLDGYSYHYIGDDAVHFPNDRMDHLLHIIRFFENAVSDPTGTGVIPLKNELAQNYPNPFNPETIIRFSIKKKAHVSLKVYDVSGRLIKTLENGNLAANSYTRHWRGTDNRGRPVASGVYFYQLIAKDFSKTRKMILLR